MFLDRTSVTDGLGVATEYPVGAPGALYDVPDGSVNSGAPNLRHPMPVVRTIIAFCNTYDTSNERRAKNVGEE